jgi:hypothetical protein
MEDDQDDPPGEGAHSMGELVEVASYTLTGEAHAAASALEGAGILVHRRNAALVGLLPHMANAFGGIGLCVPAVDADRARRILGAPALALVPDDDAEERDDAAEEPADDSRRAAPARRAWRAAVIGLVFFPGVLHLVSLYHLVRYAGSPGPASARTRRQARWALIVNLAVAAAILYGLVALLPR